MKRRDEMTIEDLEGQRWPPPEIDTSLAQTVHRLRRVPLGQFAPADLGVMIGQGVGLPYLIPKALAVLDQDPFLETDYYPGDLLMMVFKVDDAFWQTMPDLRRQAVAILDVALDRADALDVADRHDLWPRLVSARARFA
jgi:CDI immunity proteins